MKRIDNSLDIIDSRDVNERIKELEDYDELLDDETEDLKILKELQGEGNSYCCDWQYGATLIRDSYFEEYAQDFAEDIGAINGDLSWPGNCIDWEEAAKELQIDYSCIDFDGVDYWIR